MYTYLDMPFPCPYDAVDIHKQSLLVEATPIQPIVCKSKTMYTK